MLNTFSNPKIFVFDGSFDGLLTSVFDSYEQKLKEVRLFSRMLYQPGLLDEPHEVISDKEKTDRVWAGLEKKLSADWRSRFYKAFLSEKPEAFQHLFDFAHYVIDNPIGAEKNYGNPSVIEISKLDKSVNRERHRMKAFIRFELTADGIFYAAIEPDFNVLPLISDFFKKRYSSQPWIIYDLKRKYGLYYDLESVSEIKFEFVSERNASSPNLPANLLDDKQELYGVLWNDYFKSTNIPARKNMKLHIQHVPKRYWKYLTEKKTN